ncbi:FAD dependent oxidoreductase, partial [Teladorsagia circumcincta]
VGCGGATGVSGGLVTAPVFFQDAIKQHLARKSLELYTRLAQLGRFRVLHNSGVELIDCPSEMVARWPFLQTEDVQLALVSPEDVALDPVALCQELARQAQAAGAQIFENCAVEEVLLGDERQVYAVNTGNGVVETPLFVDASGIWTGTTLVKPLPYRHVRMAAYPCTYSYIHSAKLPTGSVSDTTPIFNDLDGKIMIRATGFKTLCAGFLEEGIRPLARQGATHGVWHHPEPDWDLFSAALEKLLFRCPTLGEIEHGDLICGMESYTPDKAPTVGHSTQAQGYYVINGFNGQGLALAGGTGEMLAEWICDGIPKLDVANLDVARFLDSHANAQYLMERVPEVASMTYSNMYNSHQCHTARNIRMSPIYHQLRDAGAVFGEIMG